jgi:molybdenum cofactor biosynthesis enzyme MoaA
MGLRYSSLKVFNYPDRLAAFRRGELLAPVHIRLKPLYHDCWYCAYRASNLQLGEEMDTKDALSADKMHEIADDIIDMGVKAVTFLGGGEPTLYKPLPDIIAKLASAGVSIACLSNGSNLKGQVADAFAEHGT